MEDKKVDWQYRFFVEAALKQLRDSFVKEGVDWKYDIVEYSRNDDFGYLYEIIIKTGVAIHNDSRPSMNILKAQWVDVNDPDVSKEKAWIAMVTAVMRAGIVKVYQDTVMLHRVSSSIRSVIWNKQFAEYPLTPKESFEKLNAPQGGDDGKNG